MNSKWQKFLSTLMLIIVSHAIASSQHKGDLNHHRCSTSHYLKYRLASEPNYAQAYQNWSGQSSSKIVPGQILSCNDSNSVVIPVAVHYSGNIDCSDLNCLIETAEAQMAVLNETFSASNPGYDTYLNDLNAACPEGYPVDYAPVAGVGTCIQFCLASLDHPESSGLAEGEPAITIRQHAWPSAGSSWSGYLNIFVSDDPPTGIGNDVLGVSVLPGAANGDGFWVKASTFGGEGQTCFSGATLNSSTNFGGGKTAVHEAGHYLGLLHTFDGQCGDSDRNPPTPSGITLTIEDTPAEEEDFSGCAYPTSCANAPISCSGDFIPFWNFMDYSDDACLLMFTEDQSAVLNAWANALEWKTSSMRCESEGPSLTSLTCPCIISDPVLTLHPCQDGKFSFSLNPTGSTLGSSYSVSGDITLPQIAYGQSHLFDNSGVGFSIDSILRIELIDSENNACSYTQLVNAPCAIYTCNDARNISIGDSHLAPGPVFGEGASHTTGDESATHANWYTFIAPQNGEVQIFSCGQMVDTRLWAYSGNCDNLIEIAASDDDCDLGDGSNDWASVVTLNVEEGSSYFIEWDDVWSRKSFEFYVIYTSSQNQSCENAIPILADGVYLAPGPDGGNGASPGIDPPAVHANWYTYRAPSDGFLDVFSCGGGSDTRLRIHQGSCAMLEEIGQSDDFCDTGTGLEYASALAGLQMTGGRTYYIEWDDIWSSYGFEFQLEFHSGCETSLDLGTGVLNQSIYQAGQTITSQNEIAGNVTLEAGSSITLESPFIVPEMQLLTARITPCMGLGLKSFAIERLAETPLFLEKKHRIH